MKTIKKLIAALMVAVMLLSTAPIIASADGGWHHKQNCIHENGTCGDNAYYTFEESTGKLIITGTGEIEEDAFFNLSEIKTVIIENGISEISLFAFARCTELTNVTISESVINIDYAAFADCTSLTSIIIPDNVRYIDWYAFCGCTNLTSITIPDSVPSIGRYAFKDTGYYNDESNWENDVLYIGKHLIEAKNTISGAYEIKDGTKSIASYAFGDCNSLICDVTLPNSVIIIGPGAFYNCKRLINNIK